MSENIQKIAAELLESGKAACVVGFAKGTIKGKCQTLIAKSPAQAADFTFDKYCANNLAVYLTKSYKLPRPVALFVKPCDQKAVTALIQEKQIKRDEVYLIGLSCEGLIDPETNQLMGRCKGCTKHNPENCDAAPLPEVEETAPQIPNPFARLDMIEKMSMEERWQFWTAQFDKCVRCYACRQACPMCYCQQCVVDKTEPRWIDSSAHPVGNMGWHLIRAFHLAGRCIGCGECERVCHQDIPLGLLNMKLGKEVFGLYGYRAGVDPEAKPPFTDYRMDDNEDFIR